LANATTRVGYEKRCRSVSRHFSTGAEVSRHRCRSVLGSKCPGAEVSRHPQYTYGARRSMATQSESTTHHGTNSQHFNHIVFNVAIVQNELVV